MAATGRYDSAEAPRTTKHPAMHGSRRCLSQETPQTFGGLRLEPIRGDALPDIRRVPGLPIGRGRDLNRRIRRGPSMDDDLATAPAIGQSVRVLKTDRRRDGPDDGACR